MNILKLLIPILFNLNIYSLSVPGLDGQNINFNDFKNKKLLIVNIATDSRYATQLGSLEQLHQKFKDSLIIVAFPCNDFKHESRTDSVIGNYIQSTYHTTYLLGASVSVFGANQSPLYSWLCSGSDNGYMDNPVPGDFFKFLIGTDGKVTGIFSGYVDPMDNNLQKAIMNQ